MLILTNYFPVGLRRRPERAEFHQSETWWAQQI